MVIYSYLIGRPQTETLGETKMKDNVTNIRWVRKQCECTHGEMQEAALETRSNPTSPNIATKGRG